MTGDTNDTIFFSKRSGCKICPAILEMLHPLKQKTLVVHVVMQ